jgi:hypothetical protein
MSITDVQGLRLTSQCAAAFFPKTTVAFPCDDRGLAAQFRCVAPLDRSIERIHIDMDDFSHNHNDGETIQTAAFA